MADALADKHLADLHATARDLEIPKFRMLGREELIAEIEARGGEPAAPKRPSRSRRGRGRGRQRERLAPEPEETKDEPTESFTGILQVTRQRHGFLRPVDGDAEDEVYVSASQVRRCELRTGDEVTGPVRAPRRGERHRALVHVDKVNGEEPKDKPDKRPRFDDLTPVVATRRIPLDADSSDVLLRAVDLLAPLAFGQRVLVAAAPRSGRTTLLRSIGRAIAAQDADLFVLLVDERPEETTAWREALPDAELAIAAADMAPADQARTANVALEKSRRGAEDGRDAVLLVDSLSRLAVATRDEGEIKRLFGSGRDLSEEGAGSLTVVATLVEGGEDDGAAERAVATTESTLITLDPELAASGITPALKPAECRVSNEEELRSEEELQAIRSLRSLLADLGPGDAANLLRERIEGSASNAELLASLG